MFLILFATLALATSQREEPPCPAVGALDPTSPTARFVALLEHYAHERVVGLDELRAIVDAQQPRNPMATPEKGIREHVAHAAFADALKESGLSWDRVRDHAVALAKRMGADDVKKRQVVDQTSWRLEPVAMEEGPVHGEPGRVRQFFLTSNQDGKPLVIMRGNFDGDYQGCLTHVPGEPPKRLGAMNEILDVRTGEDGLTTMISAHHGFRSRSIRVTTLGKPFAKENYEIDISGIPYEHEPKRPAEGFIFTHEGKQHLFYAYGDHGKGAIFALGARNWEPLPELPGPTAFARAHDGKQVFALSAVTKPRSTALEIRDLMTNQVLDTVVHSSKEPVAAGDLALHAGANGERYAVVRSEDGKVTAFDVKRKKKYVLPEANSLRQTSPPFLDNRDGTVTFFYSGDGESISAITFPGGAVAKVKLPSHLRDDTELVPRQLPDGRLVVIGYGEKQGLVLADMTGMVAREKSLEGDVPAGVIKLADGRLALAMTTSREEDVVNEEEPFVYHPLKYLQLFGPTEGKAK